MVKNNFIVLDFLVLVLRAIDPISVQYREVYKERKEREREREREREKERERERERKKIVFANRRATVGLIVLSGVVLRSAPVAFEHWEKKIGLFDEWNWKTWRMYDYVRCNNEVLYNTLYLLYGRSDFSQFSLRFLFRFPSR